MKVYTQADFDGLKRDKCEYLHCDGGDWTGVNFRQSDRVIFGDECVLGDGSELGECCRFGRWCLLGSACVLGKYCKLGECNKLGDGSELDEECELGYGCTLGKYCKLGVGCEIGSHCTLGAACEMEAGRVQNATFFKVSDIGSENRTAYCYCDMQTGSIFVRAGCWFSDLPAFEERVKAVHGGTEHEQDYLALAAFARARFARYAKNA